MSNDNRYYRLAVLPGDGIGAEVIDEALRVLKAAAVCFEIEFDAANYLVGGAALDAGEDVLPHATLEACLASDAVLLGAVGGPRWDNLPADNRPERALLWLRKELGVYANLRPVVVSPEMALSSPLRPEFVDGTDLMVVRELIGGIYFGESSVSRDDAGVVQKAGNTMSYTREEVRRVARTAFEVAVRRSGKVTSVDKANVLDVSRLWRDAVTEVHREEYPEMKLEHLYIDNAAMQLVRRPTQFDVILTANLFGDILSDLSATLVGSLGMLPSASIGGRAGLFEPVHGSAPDIAGEGKANPAGAILSAAMMLDVLGEAEAASSIRRSVAAVLQKGIRTADMQGDGVPATTVEFGAAVAGELAATGGSRNGHSKTAAEASSHS